MRTLRQILGRDARGVAAVEFALAAPFFIALLFGVFQISIGMHNYNSLRGAAEDTARLAVVGYQDGNRLDEQALTARARTIATASPYNLRSSRLTVTVDVLSTSRVAGAVEATMDLEYRIPSVLGMIGIDDIETRYSRSIFLIS